MLPPLSSLDVRCIHQLLIAGDEGIDTPNLRKLVNTGESTIYKKMKWLDKQGFALQIPSPSSKRTYIWKASDLIMKHRKVLIEVLNGTGTSE